MEIIIKAWQTMAEYNQTDLAGILTYPANTYNGFIPMMLVTLFTITLMATYFSKKRLGGGGDFPVSFAVAGFFTVVIAIIMTTLQLLDTTTLSITIAVALIGVIFLFISKRRE